MPQVEMVMTAEEGDTLRALLNVARAQKELEEQTKKNKKASEDWGSVSEKALSSAKQKGMDFGVTMKGVEGIIGTAGAALKAFAEYGIKELERAKEKADSFRGSVLELDKALSSTGDIQMLPELMAQLDTMRSKVLDAKQIRSLYAGLKKEAGGEFTPQQVLEFTQSAVRAADAGYDAKAFGSTKMALADAGMVDDETGTLDDKTAELLRDFQDGLNDDQKKYLAQAKSAGLAQNDTLALLKATKQGDQASKGALKIVELANEEFKDADFKPKKQKTQAQEDELAKIEARQLEIKKRELQISEEMEASSSNRGATPQGRKNKKELEALGLEDRRLSIRAQDIEAAAPMVLTPDQEQKKRLAAIPKGKERLNAILANPELAGEDKLQVKAILDSLDPDAFNEAGMFNKQEASRRGTINRDPRLRAAQKLRELEIEEVNRKANPRIGEMLQAIQGAEADQELQAIKEGKRGAFAKFKANTIGDMDIPFIGKPNDLGKGLAIQSESNAVMRSDLSLQEMGKALMSIDSKTKNVPSVSRPPGGTEQDPSRGY